MHGCTNAICDKVKQSAEGVIQAITEFITRRGNELNENDVSRTTQSLLSATSFVEKHLRQEVLGAICCLAENTSMKVVFNEMLTAAGRDIATKDVSRLRGGWPMQDAFYAFSQHAVLSILFLEHVVSLLNPTPMLKGDPEKGESGNHSFEILVEEDILQAAVLALTALFRGGGKTGKKAVEQSYAIVLSALTLQLGSSYGLAAAGQQEPLWTLLPAFQAFCDCVGDLEMGKILARGGDQNENEKWISLIGDLASCVSMKRPKEVEPICSILSKALNRQQRFQKEAAAAALSEFVRYSGVGSLLEEMVEVMCAHVADDSPAVRRLCLRALVQIPSSYMLQCTTQVLGVIVALLEDPDESVQLTAVQSLQTVLQSSAKEAVHPVLLNLSVRLRSLLTSLNGIMRANAFASFGALSNYGYGTQHETFLEQVHATLPRLILHVHDDDSNVRQACRNTLRRLAPLIGVDSISALFNTTCFNSDHRSDYEDFMREIARQLYQNFATRTDSYMVSAIQAFDAPWPVIQANAIYFSSSMLSISEDLRSLVPYYTQVFGMLISKMSHSPDAVVRATCSSALGILMKTNTLAWRGSRLDRSDSARRANERTPQS